MGAVGCGEPLSAPSAAIHQPAAPTSSSAIVTSARRRSRRGRDTGRGWRVLPARRRTPSIADTSVSASRKRAVGLRRVARTTIEHTGGGSWGSRVAGDGTAWSTCSRATRDGLGPSKGTAPVSSSYSTMPME